MENQKLIVEVGFVTNEYLDSNPSHFEIEYTAEDVAKILGYQKMIQDSKGSIHSINVYHSFRLLNVDWEDETVFNDSEFEVGNEYLIIKNDSIYGFAIDADNAQNQVETMELVIKNGTIQLPR